MPSISGRTYLAIPGPSVIPDSVLNAMHRASPNIYEGDIIGMTGEIFDQLKQLAGTRHHVAIYIANGHGGWEAALSNMFSRGDKALVLASGLFGTGWAAAATQMGVDIEIMDFGRSAADPARLEDRLRADTDRSIKYVMVTHVDTASSVRNDLKAIRRAIDAADHPALLAVDAIASLGCDELRMDDWGIDLLIGASQKGLMLPPGLALLWLSNKALAAAQEAGLATPYWAAAPRVTATEFWRFFGGTPPTQHLYGLHEALRLVLVEEGLDAVWRRHRVLAAAIWAAFDAWGAGGTGIGLNVTDPAMRGHSVTAARIADGNGLRLRRWLETEAGVTLGVGLGMAAPDEPAYGDYLRIGHMGHVNAHMVMGVLGTMEAGLNALDVPHGSGALEAAARVLGGRQ
ncbi:MAG: alanine--glyoxylate aminotransferase family protein [Devosia sp.]|uniref:pyridoxal-phosphate-dependent aminotransferase family protein n=1 Tax=Devosia sp. TaxID=1871048 RepID=UPI0024CDB043|nr:aminotransferase class V-fold PLP-dependent enzyme [Devosia sp.]UYO00636.1 MAG: alanine--glyoxylate aminotransferase family protein [Devosia sp.]